MARACSAAVVFWCLAVSFSMAFERPVISIGSPHGLNDDGTPVSYSSRANVSVAGEIKPPVGKSVTVRIYNVLGDGKLLRMAGADTPVRDGRFLMSIDPPSGGWSGGRMRVVVSLDNLRQVKSSVDLTVVPAREAAVVAGSSPPIDSGIILDLAKSRGTTVRIPPNKLFYIRGQFECEGIDSKLEGPNVWGSIIKEPFDGKGKVTYQSGSSLSIRDGESKSVFGYEIELLAPRDPGIFGIRVTPQAGMWLGELDREKPDFVIYVSEPDK